MKEGLAFILVVWVLVLLIALGTEFAFSMRTEVNTTRNFKEDREAYFLAKAGVQLAMAELLQKASFHSITQDQGLIIGRPGALAGEDETGQTTPATTPQEPVEEPLDAIYAVAREDIPLGQGTVTYTIEDENGKLNLNRVSREILVQALALNGLEQGSKRDEIADCILDWMDADDNHRLNGAENDYYLSQFPPYRAKNGPLDSLEELLRVKGMTPELLYGDKDYDNPENADNKEELKPGLARLFTVYNTPFFNPNTASVEVLKASFPEDKVQEILNTKEEKGFYGFTISSHFRIRATGNLNDSETRHTIVAVLEKVGTDEKAKMLVRYWRDNDISG